MALTKADLQAIGALMDDKLSVALEPINHRLEKLGQGQAKLEQGQVRLEEGQAKLEQRQTKLEEGQAKLEQRQTRLEEGQAKLEQRQTKLEEGQTKLEQGQADLQQSLQVVRMSQLKVEIEQYPRIAAALDGVVGAIEKDKEQDKRIVVLEQKADSHDTRIYALEASLKKAL